PVSHILLLSLHVALPIFCLFQSHDKAEKRGLTGTVGADDTHDAVGWKHEVEVVEQQFVAERLCHLLGFNHLVAQTGAVRDKDYRSEEHTSELKSRFELVC